MAANGGKVRAEGKDFIMSVNTSWNEFRNSTNKGAISQKAISSSLKRQQARSSFPGKPDLEGWYFAVVPANSIATVCEVAIWTRTDIA